MTLRLVLATANQDKVKEITAIFEQVGSLALLARPSDVADVEETGSTLLENARLKARALVEATAIAEVADDTGLFIDAFDGAPGVYSARYAGDHATDHENVTKVLEAFLRLKDQTVRSARFMTVALAIFPDGTEVMAEGSVEGLIIDEERGTGGFGYDPIFVPLEGDGRTFGEMPEDEKNAMSHRGRAFRLLADRLEKSGAFRKNT